MDENNIKKRWDIAKYAYKNSAFYIRLAEENNLKIEQLTWNDWNCIPPIGKTDVIEQYNALLSFEYLAKKYQDALVQMHTSGSSGTCMNVLWDRAEADKSLSALWLLRYRYFKIRPNNKYCYFFTTRAFGKEEPRYVHEHGYVLGICKNNLSMEALLDIYNNIMEFQPKWMLLQPSIAELLCRIKEKHQLPKIENLLYIELTGEMISEGLRKQLKDLFECEIRSQYGCNEAFSIAYECNKGNLHCMEQNVYVEILDDYGNILHNKTEGNIYITSLNNRAMPFIRYAIGDRGMLIENNCTCGRKGRILKLTSGRSNEMAETNTGEKVNGYVFTRTIEIINHFTDNSIKQFQVIQEDYDEFLVRMVLDDESEKDFIPKMFHDNFYEPLLNQAKFSFQFYDALFPDEHTGKRNYFLPMVK